MFAIPIAGLLGLAAWHAALAGAERARTTISQTEWRLAECLANANEPPVVKAPQQMLEIKDAPAAELVPPKITTIPFEWVQPLARNEDYELEAVGVCGWAVRPRFVDGDFPFSHAFGFDWEFSLALDRPATDPARYDFVLSPGNKAPSFRPNALEDDRPRRGVSRSAARSSRQTWFGARFSSWQC